MKPKEVAGFGFTADYGEARAILDAVTDFCISADMQFPSAIYLGRLAQRVSPARAAQLRDIAEKLWQQMCDPSSAVPMSHDGYLKLYQLSRPRLPGDYVMIDEFQDTNPVVLDIIAQQTQPVIVVGDAYQSIYAFRGAVNAMQDFRCQFNFALTHSRRFGPGVAEVANELLHGCFGEKLRIVGAGSPTIVHGGGQPEPQQLSIVTRTNAELFDHAVQAYRSGLPTAFIGGVAGYEFERFCDLQRLSEARVHEIKDPFIRSFSGLWEVSDYAETVDDYALKRMLETLERFGAGIYELVDGVHAKATTDQQSARRVLTTAHKSKGSTLDHVVLGEDFKPLVEQGPGGVDWVDDLDPQEVNLSYVACTRAKHSLQLCGAIKDYRAFYKAGGHLAGADEAIY
jgi:F-box protein, helicase, 18